MSDYLKSTNFATKDALPSGNAGKIVKGTELDNEFNAIADAIESKADLLNPTFSGLLTTDTLTTGGATSVGGTLAVAGALSAAEDVQFTGTGRVLVPKGTTAQRPVSAASGSLRYNTTLGYLENYTGTEWRSVGYVTPADVSDKENTSTGYFQVPKGTVAQRPVTPVEGIVRYNSEADIYEGYIGGEWHRFLTAPEGEYNISYLIAAGGGGASSGSGAGAGGLLTGTITSVPTTVYSITIGGGGAGGSTGYNGTNSSISGIVTVVGGGGSGAVGGSGGGGYGGNESGSLAQPGALGTTGQGYNGGAGGSHASGYVSEGGNGGGGGAGGVGGDGAPSAGGTSGAGGSGGIGYASSISGSIVYYAGGGGGGGNGGGTGGAGGGGNGGTSFAAGTAGAINTGSGGGGGGYGGLGASGGSGFCILSIPTANYTGNTTGSPVVTTVGSNTVLRYTISGTYTA